MHEAAGTNVVLRIPEDLVNVGMMPAEAAEEPPDLFDGCDVVVKQQHREPAGGAVPARGAGGRDAVGGRPRSPTGRPPRLPTAVKAALVRAVRGATRTRCGSIAPDVGGGFGAKIGGYPEELFVAWVARRLGRPARWVETRSESMLALGHGRAQIQEAELGGTRDGKLLAYRLGGRSRTPAPTRTSGPSSR